MSFIGIVANKKDEIDIVKNLKLCFENCKKKPTFVYIQSDNIDNIKNIKFESIFICKNNIIDEKQKILKQILENVGYIIVNVDVVGNDLFKSTNAMVITYGFQAKATITMSSINDENMILCIQREFININNINIEPQEICIELNHFLGNKYSKMCSFAGNMLYKSEKM